MPIERIVPSELDGDEQFRRNGEYVSLDAVADLVVETTQTMADGYRSNVTSVSSDDQIDRAQACAVAVSNAGVFVLQAMGFSMDEIKALVEKRRNK